MNSYWVRTRKSIELYKQYLKSKRFAESTIRTYLHSIQLFLAFFKERAIGSLTNEDVIVFNNEYILVRKLSSSFQNQMVNSFKYLAFTFRYCLK